MGVLTAMGALSTSEATFTLVNGLTIKQMGMELTLISVARYTKAFGKMICRVEKGRKLGKTVPNIKASIKKAKRKVLVSFSGRIEVITRENSKTIISKAKASILGTMAGCTMDPGKII